MIKTFLITHFENTVLSKPECVFENAFQFHTHKGEHFKQKKKKKGKSLVFSEIFSKSVLDINVSIFRLSKQFCS